MLIKRPPDVPSSDLTSEDHYWHRRRFIKAAAGAGAGVALASTIPARLDGGPSDHTPPSGSGQEELTSYDDVTTYNNYYEFGVDKGDPARHAHMLETRPWTVKVEGECHKPGEFDIDDLTSRYTQEERVYRLRCVEAWSMVIPWVGFSISKLLNDVQPTSNAKFLEMTTLLRPEQMPGQRRRILDWPYVEGLRIDEAMHPLAIFATGVYGESLPNQNGAPIRLVVPWKYGFKSVKSIVSIRLVEQMPHTAWNKSAPHEYGFYANVNPNVDHPRWSQKRERPIGKFRRIPTLMFNGYADDVAHLYEGMDLTRSY